MNVDLISVGTELLLGNVVNTNANYLSKKCAELGLSLYYQTTVGDNYSRLTKVLEECLYRSDIIIITGGLGPTQDDMTKEAVAQVLKKELIIDPHSKDRISEYFSNKNSSLDRMHITNNNWKQALTIEGAIVLDNDNGTAPGYIVKIKINDGYKSIILLPGPPSEMIAMFEGQVYQYLHELQDKVFLSKMVKICGIGEAKAETMIEDLIDKQTNPTIAPYAKEGEVHFRVTASASSVEEAEKLIWPVIEELERRFKDNIYSIDENESLEDLVVKLLKKLKMTLSTAESCTGGLFTGRIVNVAGISDIFKEGYITYADEAKVRLLGVNKETIDKYGVVSEEVAREMAEGACKVSASDTSIAITGIAGPGGASQLKPVGLVYIACKVKENITVKEYNFKGNRQKVRARTVVSALDLLRRSLTNYQY
ncbi:MAG TPA: competence/damage-inducible protein A [Clostridiales bacterium]|nr:competence/damage-inducible protein A [Clostridiales bacterium]